MSELLKDVEDVLHLTDVELPQNADALKKAIRKKVVDAQKKHYGYTYDTNIPKSPMLAPDPISKLVHVTENPKVDWLAKVVQKLGEIFGDVAPEVAEKLRKALNDPNELFDLFKIIAPTNFDVRPKTISDYLLVFDKTNPPFVTREFDLDAAFARWRLAGPNPMTITMCSKKVLDEKVNWAAVNEPTRAKITKALKDQRLFVVDYSDLSSFESAQNGKTPKFAVGPLALFEIPEEAEVKKRQYLRPLAIQCDRYDKANPAGSAVFTPDDGVKWKIAKAIFNSADGDIHEAVVHLGYTHLLVETFVVGTNRTLPHVHPIYVLLKPHFEGTAFINFLADKALINPGGTVDKLVSQEIHQLDAHVGEKVLDILSQDFSFPALLERRQMDEKHFPAPFPYRDDGRLIWDAVLAWVTAYLHIYYGDGGSKSTQLIKDDYELQEWITELRDAGRVAWLKTFDNTLEKLTTLVAAILFTASAQHAAMNFPQEQIESFTPAFPLAIYQPPPAQNASVSEQDYLNTLPAMEAAWAQRKVGYLLGGIHHTQLGQYQIGHFVDMRVVDPLQKFQRALIAAGQQIEQRNKERVAAWGKELEPNVAANWSYTYLLPQNIPQSINI